MHSEFENYNYQMKTRHTSILLLLLALLFSVPLSAQKLSVESMKLDITDVTGSLAENLVPDNNGNYGGLVRVYLPAPNATFEGAVLRQQKHSASEYWVVVAKDYYRLKVVVPGFQPLDVNFRDYNITGIESQRTYVLTINVPQLMQAGPVDDGMRYLTMTVEPKGSTVYVDSVQREVLDGEVSVYLPMGRHTYSVSAPGYATQEGSVNLTDNTPTQEVRLVSTRATLRVECATRGARVFIDGQQRGTAPWSGPLYAGNHKVEVRLDGYHPQQQSVSLSEKESRTLTFPALQQMVGRLNVNYRPLGSEVLVDGIRVGTSPNVFRDIAVGPRRVEIRKEGYQPQSQTVTIKENEQSELSGSLTAIASPTASASTGVTTNATTFSNSSNVSSNSCETFTVNGVLFTMIRVDGGTFAMGATVEQGSDAEDDEKPAHEVTLSTYMIGETEVTQALWQAVMGSNPSYFKDKPQNPVENVSWDDCIEFIKKLNSLTGKSFRLPTEAEWEFAARGGNKSNHYKYSGSNILKDVAWCSANNGRWTLPVKKKSANELGLYDMSGNVCEWCSGWYDSYSSSAQTDTQGASGGSQRVFRGGSWGSFDWNCRVSIRSSVPSDFKGNSLGLRLAL